MPPPPKPRCLSPVSLRPMTSSDEQALSYGSKSAPVLPQYAPAPSLTRSSSLPPALPAAISLDLSSAQSAADGAARRLRTSWTAARPWRDFLDARAVKVPAFRDVTETVVGSFVTWRGNYEVIAAAWCAFALVMSLGRVLAAAIGLFCVERWVRRRAEEDGLGPAEKGAALVAVLVVVWVTGVGKVVVESALWVTGIVAVHALLRGPGENGGDTEMVVGV